MDGIDRIESCRQARGPGYRRTVPLNETETGKELRGLDECRSFNRNRIAILRPFDRLTARMDRRREDRLQTAVATNFKQKLPP